MKRSLGETGSQQVPADDSVAQIRQEGEITYQANAPPDLVMLSQLAGGTDYVYDSRAADGTTVYLFDTGVDSTFPALQNKPIRWLWPDLPSEMSAWDQDTDKIDCNADQHGTLMLSKIMSDRYGVAKKTKAVVVRWPGTIKGCDFSNPFYVLKAFAAIIADAKQNNLQGKAVISIPSGKRRPLPRKSANHVQVSKRRPCLPS